MSPRDIAAELAAWQELADLVDQQRQMIIQREHDGMPELNRRLAQAFAEASRMRYVSGSPLQNLHANPRAFELDQLQRRVRAAAAVNSDLIADVLAFVDFSIELLCPQIAGPVYRQDGRLARRPVAISVNHSA